MIIYSVTVSLAPEVEADWREWMVSTHVPNIMATGCFVERRITKVIDGHEEGAINYNIQYMCDSSQKLNEYIEKFAPKLQAEHGERFKQNFIAFKTILEIVD